MSENMRNFFDVFGIATVTRVCNMIGPVLKEYDKSKALATIRLSSKYREFTKKEQVCMLNILHVAFGGIYQHLIQELNIKQNDKETYIEKAKAGNF